MRVLLGIAALALALASLPSVATATPADEATAPGAQGPGLMIQADMVVGNPGPCILQNRFAPGERVVFRAKVYDPHTGQEVTDGTVTVRLDNGINIPMRYGPHPPPNVGPATDDFWAAVWAIPPDTPMGIVRFTIEATSGNRAGTYVPFNRETSMLTVVPVSS